MPKHVVTASELNLRSTPNSNTNTNRLAILPNGHAVEDLDRSHSPWWRVRTLVGGAAAEGFVHSTFLAPAGGAPAVEAASGVRAVHLGEHASASPNSASARAWALPGGPRRPAATPAQILDFLDVERGARYRPTPSATYCNIYAYDFAYLSGVYLPRVWWNGPALERLARGETVEVRYGVTVFEQNANALYSWLIDYGPRFGWTRILDLDDMQRRVNAGATGMICAQRSDLNRSGHIAAVVPESGAFSAARTGGRVVRPLQSQAGATNHKYTSGPRAWWLGAEFRAFGFFVTN